MGKLKSLFMELVFRKKEVKTNESYYVEYFLKPQLYILLLSLLACSLYNTFVNGTIVQQLATTYIFVYFAVAFYRSDKKYKKI